MPAPSYENLRGLAAWDARNAEDALKQVYEWRHHRAASVGITLLGAALSFIASLLIAVLQEKTSVSGVVITWVMLSSGVLTACAVTVLLQMRRIHHEYLFASELLALLRLLA
jgi:hypothetical protein